MGRRTSSPCKCDVVASPSMARGSDGPRGPRRVQRLAPHHRYAVVGGGSLVVRMELTRHCPSVSRVHTFS